LSSASTNKSQLTRFYTNIYSFSIMVHSRCFDFLCAKCSWFNLIDSFSSNQQHVDKRLKLFNIWSLTDCINLTELVADVQILLKRASERAIFATVKWLNAIRRNRLKIQIKPFRDSQSLNPPEPLLLM